MFLNVTVNKRERDIHVVKRAQACDANQMLLPSLYTSITDPVHIGKTRCCLSSWCL